MRFEREMFGNHNEVPQYPFRISSEARVLFDAANNPEQKTDDARSLLDKFNTVREEEARREAFLDSLLSAKENDPIHVDEVTAEVIYRTYNSVQKLLNEAMSGPHDVSRWRDAHERINKYYATVLFNTLKDPLKKEALCVYNLLNGESCDEDTGAEEALHHIEKYVLAPSGDNRHNDFYSRINWLESLVEVRRRLQEGASRDHAIGAPPGGVLEDVLGEEYPGFSDEDRNDEVSQAYVKRNRGISGLKRFFLADDEPLADGEVQEIQEEIIEPFNTMRSAVERHMSSQGSVESDQEEVVPSYFGIMMSQGLPRVEDLPVQEVNELVNECPAAVRKVAEAYRRLCEKPSYVALAFEDVVAYLKDHSLVPSNVEQVTEENVEEIIKRIPQTLEEKEGALITSLFRNDDRIDFTRVALPHGAEREELKRFLTENGKEFFKYIAEIAKAHGKEAVFDDGILDEFTDGEK